MTRIIKFQGEAFEGCVVNNAIEDVRNLRLVSKLQIEQDTFISSILLDSVIDIMNGHDYQFNEVIEECIAYCLILKQYKPQQRISKLIEQHVYNPHKFAILSCQTLMMQQGVYDIVNKYYDKLNQ